MDTDTQPTPIEMWGFTKPPPLRWLVENLAPEGFLTVLAADGGTGKSYLAMYLSLCLALGRRFFSLATTAARVLYVDYELDEAEQKRRLWRVAGGAGVSVDDPALEGRIFYHRPSQPLSDIRAHEEILGIIEQNRIGFTVLDSLTIGSSGADASSSTDMIAVMQAFRNWGTVLAIDHLSKGAARGTLSEASPFGSVFKRNIARSTAALTRAPGGGLVLAQDKSNFGTKRPLLCYEAEFDEATDVVRFREVERTDASMAGAERYLDPYDITLLAVEELFDGGKKPVTVDALAKWRAENDDVPTLAVGTLRNHLTVLERRKAISRDGDGTVVPVRTETSDIVTDAALEPPETPPSHGG